MIIATVSQIFKDEFMRLSTDQMWKLWKTIRWPKSYIDAVAKPLTFLKNRTNRYPNLTRNAFAANHRAMAIVATEYNCGATSSEEANAGPTWYGSRIADIFLIPTSLPEVHTSFSHE